MRDKFSFEKPTDIIVYVSYQTWAKLLTYVQLNVYQDSEFCNVSITDGGVNQKFISVVIKAKSTYNFGYEVNMYGHDSL